MTKRKTLPSILLAVQGLLWFLSSLLLFLCLASYKEGLPAENCLGLIGYMVATTFFYLSGLSAFFIPFFLSWLGMRFLLASPLSQPKRRLLWFSLFLVSSSLLLTMIARSFPSFAAYFERWVFFDGAWDHQNSSPVFCYYLGGVPFDVLYGSEAPWGLEQLCGKAGTALISGSLLLISLSLLFEISPVEVIKKGKEWSSSFKSSPQPLLKEKKLPEVKEKKIERPIAKKLIVEEEKVDETSLSRPHPLLQVRQRPALTKAPVKEEKAPSAPKQMKESIIPQMKGDYTLPSSNLLTLVPPNDSSDLKDNLRQHAAVLEETLLSFGIEAKVGDIHCGPTITLFEVHPAIGVKVQKIKALENDIAMNLQAKSIRIIAPIPGKAAVGIEVPNPQPQEVSFRELFEYYQGLGKRSPIPLLLGKVVNGDAIWTDLTKMPHCLIAGATGSGKSVCINTIVMSILMTARPDEVKLVMVDPKKVELTAYSRLPHMLAPVITEPTEAHAALRWLVKEMERRYELFRLLGMRHLTAFNSRTINKEKESQIGMEVPDHLPYIVVIIDELADLMMVSSSDIETPIARIAQMARAVGIHLILATQRPSREVITGLIKANFPTRISFKVSSRVNSQIILDENGAETLLGNGDMLFIPPGTSTLMRAQGAYVRDEDIHRVIDFICEQVPTQYLIPSFQDYHDQEEKREGSETTSDDPLYEEAKNLVLKTGTASTTFLQRKLKVGYARAASLMDALEASGIIGPQDGAKPRKIFYPSGSQSESFENDDEF